MSYWSATARPGGPPPRAALWAPALWMMGAYVVVFLAAMALLFAQRYRQPIKARSPALLAVSSLGGAVVARRSFARSSRAS